MKKHLSASMAENELMDIISIEESFRSLDEWLECTGWEGYDVSDIKALPFFILLSNARENSKIGKYIAHPFFYWMIGVEQP